eukprot:TCONS_00032856-protein
MLKRNRLIYIVLILLALLNFIFYWFFTIEEADSQKHLESELGVTIIIPYFESFDHDLHGTVRNIHSIHPDVNILILSESIPYPYPKISHKNVRFVYKQQNPAVPKRLSDPLTFVDTNFILIMPDGARMLKDSVETLMSLAIKSNRNIVSSPIDSPRCSSIEFDIKRWTLTYNNELDKKSCNFIDGAVLLFRKNVFTNFSESFTNPFYESFFIQAKLNHLSLKIVSNQKLFTRGKFLFTNSHLKWKHETKIEKQQTDLYQRFGVKRLLTANGIEKWFGCTRLTQRCFPSVIDTPSFLFAGRWTPPCCLQGLRKTAQHVFSTIENAGIFYWLEGGSLLGAARHHDIIPWDYDVDIGIYMNDIIKIAFLNKVWTVKEKYEDFNGYVWERATEGEFIRVQYSKTNHLHVDIFPFFERNGIMTKNTWFKSHRQDKEFPVKYLKPLERLKFVGVDALVPNNYREFLEMKFGPGVIENPKYPFPEKLTGVIAPQIH